MLNKVLQFFKGSGNIPSGGTVPLSVLKEYYSSRTISRREHICHAPFNNMYFNTEGHVANCWLTFYEPEIYDGTRSIKDIWNGEKFTKLRRQIRSGDLETSCKTCQNYLLNKNFTNVLAKAYDNEYPLTEYPSMMELELSNDCNLECTMCNGLLSSSIRKNREHLPALRSPYGDRFVEELREFIPHLREMRFNGGEPFLISIYFKIWDAVFELNPKLRMVIATNGSVLNARVKDYLSKGNFHINLSMDGFSKDTYEKVRINANHDRMMQNFEYFQMYCRENDRTLCVMINPMRQNWQEMPDFVNFCNKNGVHLWFNTIMRPEDQAIWNLPAEQLRKIYSTLSKAIIYPNTNTSRKVYNYNLSTYHNLVQHQIKDWLADAERNPNNHITEETLSPELSFWLKMENYIRSDKVPNAESEINFLKEKIRQIKLELNNEWDNDKAYRSMLKAEMSLVYSRLKEDDTKKLSEMMRVSLRSEV